MIRKNKKRFNITRKETAMAHVWHCKRKKAAVKAILIEWNWWCDQ